MSTVTTRWSVRTPTARHAVQFRHNSLTGRRTLWLNDKIIFQSGLRYRLTGSVTFSLADGAEAKVLIDSSPVGALTYTLVANGRKVDEGTKARGSVWSVPLGPGASGEAAAASSAACTAADVEFDHDTFDVLVNNRTVECEAGFMPDGEGDGSVYTVPLPNGETCDIVVSVTSKGNSTARLVYADATVPTVEEQGAAASASSEAVVSASGVAAD